MDTVIITGASSGIGASMAEYFSGKNWKVILVARNAEKLQSLQEKLPQSEAFVCDLTQKNDIKSFVDKISNKDNIKALVNNAGVFRPCSVDDDQDDVWDEHYQSNLMSAVRLTRALWPTLKANKASILNISSTLAVRPIVNTSAYSAIKAAMNNWTLGLALEGAPFGVRANAICPGIVDTPIHGFHGSQKPEDVEFKESLKGAQPLGRIGQPQDIAAAAYHFCSQDSAWTTGTLLNIDGGILLNS